MAVDRCACFQKLGACTHIARRGSVPAHTHTHTHTLQVPARACAHRLRAAPWVRPGAVPRVRPG
eukprot:11964990-Alexandrium_andersonii.AAC.1